VPFIDDEFLFLSRGGRIGPGTNARLGEPRTMQERIRRELAAQYIPEARAQRARRPWSKRSRKAFSQSRAASAVNSVVSGGRRPYRRGER
jgi:hypothetical protein